MLHYSHYNPDFLSSLCILAESNQSPYAIDFTTQHAIRTRDFYDIMGEPIPQDDGDDDHHEKSASPPPSETTPPPPPSSHQTLSGQEYEFNEVINTIDSLSNLVFTTIEEEEEKPNGKLHLFDYEKSVNKNTWVTHTRVSKNIHYTDVVKKHQLRTYLASKDIITITKKGSSTPTPEKASHKCPIHDMVLTADQRRSMSMEDQVCDCPFKPHNADITDASIRGWQSLLKASTTCGKIGEESKAKIIKNSAEAHHLEENQRLYFHSLLTLLGMPSGMEGLDHKQTVDLIAYVIRNDPKKFMDHVTGTKSTLQEEKLYYFILDQPAERISASLRCSKNTLFPVVNRMQYCSTLTREYEEVNQIQAHRKALEMMGIPDQVMAAFVANRCLSTTEDGANDDDNAHPTTSYEDGCFGDWFSVCPVQYGQKCILAIRKDIFLGMKSTWMCHHDTNVPIYGQLLKHWNMSSSYKLVNKIRKFNVLRKVLNWLYSPDENKNIHFMLSPDHADFEDIYEMLFGILRMWNTDLETFKNAMTYSYENTERPSLLKSVVSMLLIKKKHVVEKNVVVALYNWLNGLSMEEYTDDVPENKASTKKSLPHLSHILYTLKQSTTLADREESLSNLTEGISPTSWDPNVPDLSYVLVKKQIQSEKRRRVSIDKTGRKNVGDGDGKLDNYLDLANYGSGVKSLKRSRDEMDAAYERWTERVDFSFLEEDMSGATTNPADYRKQILSEYKSKFKETFGVALKNKNLLYHLDDYTHILNNVGCYCEYQKREEFKRASLKIIANVKKVDRAIQKRRRRGDATGGPKGVRNKRKPTRASGYVKLSKETMRKVCDIIRCVKSKASTPQHANKKAKMDHVKITDDDDDEHVLQHKIKQEHAQEKKQEPPGVDLVDENNACEEWLMLGEYFAIKVLYQACLCESIPVELRKQLFLGILLVNVRKGTEKRKREVSSEYQLVVSTKMGEPQPDDDDDDEGYDDGGGISWSFGPLGRDREAERNTLVPVSFTPPYLKHNGTGYISHLNKIGGNNTSSLLEYLGSIVPDGEEDDDDDGQDQQNIGGIEEDEWLWNDTILFGDDDAKLQLMKKLSSKESDGVGRTQILFFAFVEFLHKIGKGKNEKEKLKLMELSARAYKPYYHAFQRNLASQRIISVGRDEGTKQRLDQGVKSLKTGCNVDFKKDTIRANEEEEVEEVEEEENKSVLLENYLTEMYKKMEARERKLSWNHLNKVNKTYDDSLIVIFYNSMEMQRWSLLHGAYFKKEDKKGHSSKERRKGGGGDEDAEDISLTYSSGYENTILKPHVLSMETYMSDKILSTLGDSRCFGNQEKRGCELVIDQIKRRLAEGIKRGHNKGVGGWDGNDDAEVLDRINIGLPLKKKDDAAGNTVGESTSTVEEEGETTTAPVDDADMMAEINDAEIRAKIKRTMEHFQDMGVRCELYPIEEDSEGMDDTYNNDLEILFISRYR